MDTSTSRINVSITPGTILVGIFAVIATILAYVLRDVIITILTSVVLASAIEPATRWFARYRVPRVLAVLIIFILIFGVMSVALYFFLPIFLQELSNLPDFLPKKIDTPSSFAPAADTLSLITSNLSSSGSFSLNSIVSSPSLISKFLAATSGMFNGLLSFILIVVISFYLAVQDRGVESFLRIVAPYKYEAYIIDLWRRTEAKIGGWAQGQLLLGLIIGPLVYLGLTLFQIKYALSLALIAAIFELIPIFGPILSAVPAVLIGFSQSFTLGILVLLFYVIVQQFENHLIYPLVVKKVVGVPALIVILALIVGGKLAGFLGIILSVPLAALIMEIAGDIEKRKIARKPI